MHELINKLAFSLFRKNSLEECTTEEIKTLAERHPYFSSAQLLLAAKEKQTGDSDFENQLMLTSLHVNNPLWLDHLLNSEKKQTTVVTEQNLTATEVTQEPHNDELVLERTSREFIVASNQQEQITVVNEKQEETLHEPSTPQPPITTPNQNPAEHRPHLKEDKLIFDPYYTVDYFASQGIKNIIEKDPKDRFSQQLKSFTDWLKTIRNMPPQQIAALSDSNSEQKVVQLATQSIEERNVDTEAMADVWIKQGHPEKAIDIYRKLSLLDPSKSSYFASLIESLKKK